MSAPKDVSSRFPVVKLPLKFVFCVLPWIMGASAPMIVDGPDLMPYIRPDMLSPDYWVRKLPEADREMCAPDQRRELEARWRAQGLLLDLNRLPEAVSGGRLRSWLTEDFRYLARVARYGEDGKRLQASDVRAWEHNVNLTAVRGSAPTAWGMTVRPTPMKLMPTHRVATVKPLDLEFNVFSHSEIRLAEPVAILHESLDREWLYVATEIGRGWVRARDVARSDRDTVLGYRRRPLRIVTAAGVRFRQDGGRMLEETAKMGTRLACDPHAGKLDLPWRDEQGRLRFVPAEAEPADGLADGPRPFTARSVIEQAFRLLDAPYGWGGAFGYGDCSEFVNAVGLACGLTLPRSTAHLRRALPSRSLNQGETDKAQALNKLPGGMCLLEFPGHVMLLLGADQGRMYVIHNFYGLHRRDARGEYVCRIARVVVSDLSLGEDSVRGSLFRRVDRALFLAPGSCD